MMLRPRILPCLLLRGTGLVKTIQFKNPTYVGDATNAVRIFNKKEADELIFLDITATRESKKPPFQAISLISDECFMPLAAGGGVRNISDVKALLQAGAEKVIINTFAVENPSFIKEAAKNVGSQSIVVSIDVRKKSNGSYEVYTRGGTKPTGLNPVNFARLMQEMEAGEIMINSIDRDGMMKGYDLRLVRMVADAVNIPVIACGGAGKLSDFRDVTMEGHASAVAAGSLFVFYGQRRGVLVNFPTKQELVQIFENPKKRKS